MHQLRGRFQVVRGRVYRFLASEDGPTAIEYAVLGSLIIAFCVLAVGAFGTSTQKLFEKSSNSLAAPLAGK